MHPESVFHNNDRHVSSALTGTYFNGVAVVYMLFFAAESLLTAIRAYKTEWRHYSHKLGWGSKQ